MKVAIFGAGISGLTVAHELRKIASVDVYEIDSVPGGFAQSSRDINGMPTEHSWRGYGPFYDNLFSILKEIPFKGGTVHDNILFNRPIEFLLPRDGKGTLTEIENRSPTIADNILLGFYMSTGLFANKRLDVISKTNFKKLMAGKLSHNGRDDFIKMLGPGLGLDENDTSLYDISKYAEIKMASRARGNKKAFGDWYLLNGPTSVKWIDPWEQFLKAEGVNFHYNCGLKKIHVEGNTVNHVEVKNMSIKADAYVICISPYSLADMIANETTNRPELTKSLNLARPPPHKQIAFAMLFKNKLIFPNPDMVMAFPDSEFNITICQQDNFFLDDPFFKQAGKDKSLWSGTACVTDVPGRVYGKPAVELTKDELCNEIKAQMFSSQELRAIISDQSLDVDYMKIWKNWHVVNGRLQSHPKWVTSTTTYGNRPSQKTSIDNLYLAGSHTKTTTSLWSMEGAVESGKLVAKYFTEPEYYSHDVSFFDPIKKVDDYLYEKNMPSISYFIMICIIILIAYSIVISFPSQSDNITKSSYTNLVSTPFI